MGGDRNEGVFGAGGIFGADEESAEPLDERPESGQRGVERDPHRYIHMGRAAVGIGADGLPAMGAEPPRGPEPGLTDANLICMESEDEARPACEHLITLVVPADGEAKGFDELRQIRRFCKRLATASELWEVTGNVYACSSRSPSDLVSLRVIKDFEKRQRELAREQSEKSGTLTF